MGWWELEYMGVVLCKQNAVVIKGLLQLGVYIKHLGICFFILAICTVNEEFWVDSWYLLSGRTLDGAVMAPTASCELSKGRTCEGLSDTAHTKVKSFECFAKSLCTLGRSFSSKNTGTFVFVTHAPLLWLQDFCLTSPLLLSFFSSLPDSSL